MKKLICKKCGHEWWPRTDKKPLVCARCKSYSWDKTKKDKESKDV